MMIPLNSENEFGTVAFHRQSLRHVIQDYVITLNEYESDIEAATSKAHDLFKQLMDHFKDVDIKARLIAKMSFIRVNDDLIPMEETEYHFASYAQERVIDVDDFFVRHMQKIGSRLDEFNDKGSRLLLKGMKHLHISLTVMNQSMHNGSAQ